MNTGEREFAMVVALLNVELGGGTDPKYHPNIDALGLANVDIVYDLSKGIPMPDNHADLIYSCDFIEHLDFACFLRLLLECRRVLKENGKIEFITPDVFKAVFTHKQWNDNIHHVIIGDDKVYRSNDWAGGEPFLRHRQWFSPELMFYILSHEGWKDIQITDYKKDGDWWKEPKMKVVATR